VIIVVTKKKAVIIVGKNYIFFQKIQYLTR